MGIIIAIDGPAGSGKSSTAKEVARRLGFTYIDTGAMYRSVTLEIIRRKIDICDEDQIEKIARESCIQFQWIDNKYHILLNGEDVSDEIRSSDVASLVSPVSAIAGIRKILAERQRQMAQDDNIVMEGRDIGTNVFPDADFKFYMDADIRVRAERRIKDYQAIGQKLSVAEIVRELEKRDKIDSSRSHSPLKKAEDAIIIDTTNLSFEEQVEEIVKIVQNKICVMD
ncbi:MAG: (d)CMP kinase [Candidatus Marinimicrobia bacterium]|nr:(d)CMP kinase [Candidatus Neomarinimicrobiota bacterium]